MMSAVALLLILVAACGGGGEEKGLQPASPTPATTPTLSPTTITPAPLTPTPAPPATPESEPYTPAPGTANFLGDGGFENGRDHWFSLKPPAFELSTHVAHSGRASALLRMRDPVEAEGTKVYYLVQEVLPKEFPEIISGYYRVENWGRGTPQQYLQVVLIAFEVQNLPDAYPHHQIRYILTGIDEDPPFTIPGFFVHLGEKEPATDQWVYFECHLREDSRQHWGAVPEGFSNLRLLFEVRYDDKKAGEGAAEADVYYDDLYMGPASENPNQP